MATIEKEGGMTIEAPYEVSGPNDPNATATPDGEENPEVDKPVGVDGDEPKDEGGDDNDAPDQEEDKPSDSDEDASLDAVAKTLKTAGLDMNEFTEEFSEKGALSDESFTKLEAAGFPRALVEQYLAGAQVNRVLAKEQETQIKSLVGGDDGYTNLIGWAGQNLPAEEVETYNAIMASGDIKSIKFAVAGLKARFDAVAEVEPSLLKGNGGGRVKQSDAYKSSAEVTAAMRDPRYGKDPAYTREVEHKVGRSNVF